MGTSSTSFAEETSSKMKIFSFQTLMVLGPFLLCIQGAPNQRIVGGVETTANEFPFLVSLQRVLMTRSLIYVAVPFTTVNSSSLQLIAYSSTTLSRSLACALLLVLTT